MVLGVLGVAGITGVIPGGRSGTASTAPPEAPVREAIRTPLRPGKCPLCGTVESIRTVEVRVLPEHAVPADVGGAAVPIGRENGVRTVLETVAEAVSGSEGRESGQKRLAYRVTVRMDDGSYRTVSQSSPPALAVGDKVRVVEGRLVRA
jgi:outer membrane lipoprotein SlyB